MKAIVDGYDSSFANRMEELPKEAKTERKALHIQRGASSLICRAGLLHHPPIQNTQYVTNAGSSCVSHMKARTTPCTPHLKDNTDLTIEIESPVETGLSIIP